ncbi:hypothetical protein [Methylocella sp.]
MLGRHRSAAHGSLQFGLCDVSPELEASIHAATGLSAYDAFAEAAE